MSRKNFHPHHIESRALLPPVLTPGTAYFIDDEKSIVIDYGDGRGAKTYGGPAGVIVRSGGNTEFLQDQINTLAGGVLVLEKNYWDETQYIRRELEHKHELAEAEITELRRLNGENAAGILHLACAVNDQAERQSDKEAHVLRLANSNAEGILRLAEVINDQADNTGDSISGLHRQVNANSEGILRLCLALYEYAAKTNELISGLKASITELREMVSRFPEENPDVPPPPPPPPKRDLILADLLMPGDILTSDGHTWKVTWVIRDAGLLTLTLDEIEGE